MSRLCVNTHAEHDPVVNRAGGVQFQQQLRFKTGTITPPREAPPLQLTDQYGQPFDLANETGKVVLLYFGYTTCPDACPTTLSDWMEVKRLLGDKADKVEFVFVTIDPDRDTTDKMRQYLDFFDPEFIGLSGTQDQITKIQQDYGIMAVREDQPDSAVGYLMNHTTSYWALDTDGKLRLVISHGTDPEIVAEDVRHLI